MAGPDVEPIVDPDLPIVDAHHHFFYKPGSPVGASRFDRYLADELLADIVGGHDIRATVFIDCRLMYRQDGPEQLRALGEVEYANGVAAMGASGLAGPVRLCAAIVGNADLRLGAAVAPVIEAHVRAGGGRYRAVRNNLAYSTDRGGLLGRLSGMPGTMADPHYRKGVACLAQFGLSHEVTILETQLGELVDLTRAVPDTPTILGHFGMPLGISGYAGKLAERFPLWRAAMRDLAACPNVTVKLGGATMVMGLPSFQAPAPASSLQLAAELQPYFDSCLELFGAARCMFESDYPMSSRTASYATLWNAYKRLAAGCSAAEKRQLFSGTACAAYRIDPAEIGLSDPASTAEEHR